MPKAKPTTQKSLHMALIGAVWALAAYALISRAFDTGSWWQYLGFSVCLVMAIRLEVGSFKTYYGKH